MPARTRARRTSGLSRDLWVAAASALLSGLACYAAFDVDNVTSWLLGLPFAAAACLVVRFKKR